MASPVILLAPLTNCERPIWITYHLFIAVSPPAVLQTFFVPPSPDPDDGHVEPTPAFRFRLVRGIHLFHIFLISM